MTLFAGEAPPAGKVQRLQPTPLWVQATGTVVASQTNADVPGCTLTFTTAVAGAVVLIEWSGDIRAGVSAPAGSSSMRANVDAGAATSPVFVVFQGPANAAVVGCQRWLTTLAAAGSHTIKLQATTNTNTVVQTYTTLTVTVYEQG